MGGYYERHLSGSRLEQVYALASPRIRQYLRAETDQVIQRIHGVTRVLELGCGYGRVLREIAPHVGRAIGNDTSRASLVLASSNLADLSNCDLVRMDAARLAFPEAVFDATICVQNGISAFGVDRQKLVAEAVRVTRNSGIVLFSTYSPRIWPDRLDWFRTQSRAGLLGELDETRSRDGTIACKDGFRSEAVSEAELRALFETLAQEVRVYEVDGSSMFAEAVRTD